MGPRWKRKRYSDEDTVWEDNKVESELGLVAENGTLGSWFKVTVSILIRSALGLSEYPSKV